MRIRHLVLFASLLAACGGSDPTNPDGPKGGDPGEDPKQEIPRITEEQAAHLQAMVAGFVDDQGYPNLAIGVVAGEELVWSAGFGEGATPGEPPGQTTLFRAGSVTKVVTATALLDLAEEGALSLDDEAARWIPEAEEILSPAGRPAITLRHLLAHASGLPRDGNGSLDTINGSPSQEEVLAALDGVTLLFDPGTDHAYSNIGVALAGMAAARASGTEYRDLVQARILDPLEMDRSVWDRPAGNLAPGHRPAVRGGYERDPKTQRLGALEPAGGLFTTVQDLARLAAHGLGHATILEEAALAESQQALRELPGTTAFGLGWLLTDVPALGRLVWHNGSTTDYGAFLGLLPEHDLGVVVLAGTGSHGDVPELQGLGVAALAWLVDPETAIVPTPVTTAPAAIEAVGERLLLLNSEPTADAIEEAFHPGFFASMSQAQLLAFFEGVADDVGGCTAYEMIEDRGVGAFHLHFDCQNADLVGFVVAEEAAPHRMMLVSLVPVP